jgi:hypothetical protein
MTTMRWLALASIAAPVFSLRLALDKEYAYWAPRVGALLINLATRFIPKETRSTRRHEWLAELDMLEQDGMHGLLFAMRLFVRSPILGIADRRNRMTSSQPPSGNRPVIWSPPEDVFMRPDDSQTRVVIFWLGRTSVPRRGEQSAPLGFLPSPRHGATCAADQSPPLGPIRGDRWRFTTPPDDSAE